MPAFLAPLLAAIGALFSRVIATRAGQWIATALAALGISYVTTEAVLDPIIGLVQSSFGGVGATAAQWMGVMNIDKYVSIVLSAYTAGGIKRAIMVKRS